MHHALLSTEEAAVYLSISPETLKKARAKRQGPPFIKIGRCIRYSPYELEKYLVINTVQTTSLEDN